VLIPGRLSTTPRVSRRDRLSGLLRVMLGIF
jgi:hypothetical protein